MDNHSSGQKRAEETESHEGHVSLADVRARELERLRIRRCRADQEVGRQGEPSGHGSAFEDPDAMKSNLVGIALSGGGIRSGAYSLGFLMGMCRSGLLRFADYVSTVSGGGYAAASLSAEAVKRVRWRHSGEGVQSDRLLFVDPPEKKLLKPRVAANPARPYPRALMDLVREGSRWLRDRTPFEFLNRFFVGGLATLVFTVCLVAAACSFLAWAFRWLYYAPVYDWLQPLGIEGDVMVPLAPSLVLFAVWLLCWAISLFDHKRRATGVAARYVFRVWLIVTVLGLVLVATSGDVDINAWLQRWGLSQEDADRLKQPLSWILPALAAAIVASLAPYLRPDLLLKSGRLEASTTERFFFRTARLALLWGMPLLMFAFFAQEDISGWNTRRDARIGESDLMGSGLFDHMLAEYQADLQGRDTASPAEEETPAASEPQPAQRDESEAKFLPGTYLLTGLSSRTDHRSGRELSDDLEQWPLLWLQRLQSKAGHVGSAAMVRHPSEQRLKEVVTDHSWGDERSDLSLLSRIRFGVARLLNPRGEGNRIAEAAYATRAGRMWKREMLYALNQRLLYADLFTLVQGNLSRLEELDPRIAEDSERRDRIEQRIAEAERAKLSLEHVVEQIHRLEGGDDPGAPMHDDWQEIERRVGPVLRTVPRSVQLWDQPERYADRTSYYADREPATALLVPAVTKRGDVVARLWQVHSYPASQHDLRPIELAWDKPHLDQAEDLMRLQQARRAVLSANRSLLEALYPDAVRPFGETVFSRHVLLKDQQTRFQIFVLTAIIALFAAFVVDLNTLSWHGYYAERLASFWVGTGEQWSRTGRMGRKHPPIRLRELCTVEDGRPYHLINASALSFARGSATFEHINGVPVDSFVLSEQFVGSETPADDDSEDGARKIRGMGGFGLTAANRYQELRLSDAIALSGAAVSPWATPNHLARAIMFVLNLRTGLWLPNPRFAPAGQRSRFQRLLYRSSFFPPVRFAWSWLFHKEPAEWTHISVSDGGFYENLALEPLLMRRCRVIFAVDATQDSEYHFDSLAQLVRRCRMRYGIEFLDPKTGRPLSIPQDLIPVADEEDKEAAWKTSPRQFTTIQIDYSGMDKATLRRSTAAEDTESSATDRTSDAELNSEGWPKQGILVFVKANLVDALPIDVIQHAKHNRLFPNDPTSDQFYDADKFESYRQLGDGAACRVVEEIFSASADAEELGVANHQELVDLIRRTLLPQQKPRRAAAPRSERPTDKLLQRYRDSILSSAAPGQIGELEEQIDGHDPVAVLPGMGYELREAICGTVPPIERSERTLVRRLMDETATKLERLEKDTDRDQHLQQLRKDPAMRDWPGLVGEWLRVFPDNEADKKAAARLLEAYRRNGLCRRGEKGHTQELIKRLSQ